MQLSFVIPAHNEEEQLQATVQACQEAGQGFDFEIIVVDDSSEDATADIARQLGARVVTVCHRQIAATRNSGANAAQGRALVFVDADTRPNSLTVQAAMQALEEGAVGGGAAFRFDRPIPLYGQVLEKFFVYFCRYAKLAAGCFVFCRRDVFQLVGGFNEGYYAAEEWVLSRALKRHGRFVILSAAVETSGRKLRAYSFWEMLKGMFDTGRSGFGSRVDLWYDRRDDLS